jgi:hypothetical protein
MVTETMNPKSKQVLQRYLNKIDKEDPTAQEDGEFDPRSVCPPPPNPSPLLPHFSTSVSLCLSLGLFQLQ